MNEKIDKVYRDYIDIKLTIPHEFIYHYLDDRFHDSLERCLYDCQSLSYKGISGRYDHEVIALLLKSLDRSVMVSRYKKLIPVGSSLKTCRTCIYFRCLCEATGEGLCTGCVESDTYSYKPCCFHYTDCDGKDFDSNIEEN